MDRTQGRDRSQQLTFEEKCDVFRSYMDDDVSRAEARRKIGDEWETVAQKVTAQRSREQRESLDDETIDDLFC